MSPKKATSPASARKEAQRASINRLSLPRASPSAAEARERRASWAKERKNRLDKSSPTALAKSIYMDTKSPSAYSLNKSVSPYRSSVAARLERSPYRAQVMRRRSGSLGSDPSPSQTQRTGVKRAAGAEARGAATEKRGKKKTVGFAANLQWPLSASPAKDGVGTPVGSPRAQMIQSASKQLDSVWALINSSPVRKTPEKFTPKKGGGGLKQRKQTPGGVKNTAKHAGHTPHHASTASAMGNVRQGQGEDQIDDPSSLLNDTIPLTCKGGSGSESPLIAAAVPLRVTFQDSSTEDFATVALADVTQRSQTATFASSEGRGEVSPGVDSDLSAERSIHESLVQLQGTPTSRFLGSSHSGANPSRFSLGSAAGNDRLSVGSANSDSSAGDTGVDRLTACGGSGEQLSPAISAGSGTSSRSSSSSSSSSGSEGYVTAEQGPSPPPNEGRRSLGELIGRPPRAPQEGESKQQDQEQEQEEEDVDTDEEDRSAMPAADASVIFMRRRHGGNTQRAPEAGRGEEEEDDGEDLDATVALGDLIGTHASKQLRERSQPAPYVASPLRSGVNGNRGNPNVEGDLTVNDTLELTVNAEDTNKENTPGGGMKSISLGAKLTPSKAKDFVGSPIMPAMTHASTRVVHSTRSSRKQKEQDEGTQPVLRRSNRKKTPVKSVTIAATTTSGTPSRSSKRLVGTAQDLMSQW